MILDGIHPRIYPFPATKIDLECMVSFRDTGACAKIVFPISSSAIRNVACGDGASVQKAHIIGPCHIPGVTVGGHCDPHPDIQS
jgi:hypothetical protein